MSEPYTTSVYPYPAAMWDEAASHLAMNRGWMAVLMVCPNPTEACATARQEMANRGIEDTYCLIYLELFSSCHCIRISRLRYIDPRWDDLEDHLLNHSTTGLIVIDSGTVDALAMIDETRAAMAERNILVTVGYSEDPASRGGMLRVEKV